VFFSGAARRTNLGCRLDTALQKGETMTQGLVQGLDLFGVQLDCANSRRLKALLVLIQQSLQQACFRHTQIPRCALNFEQLHLVSQRLAENLSHLLNLMSLALARL
jgi:hypothetical protein